MARKKQVVQSQTDTLIQKIKQNLQSIVLGAISIVLIGILLFKAGTTLYNNTNMTDAPQKNNNAVTAPPTAPSAPQAPGVQNESATNSATMKQGASQDTYVVKAGDSLWTISEQIYGSGYNQTDIAKANKIENPSIIEVGQKLVLPKVTPQSGEKGEITPEATKTQQVQKAPTTYTVKHDDFLWNIAIEMYGDGYAWVKIARANNLIEPNVIHVGNVLQIPR